MVSITATNGGTSVVQPKKEPSYANGNCIKNGFNRHVLDGKNIRLCENPNRKGCEHCVPGKSEDGENIFKCTEYYIPIEDSIRRGKSQNPWEFNPHLTNLLFEGISKQ